MPVLVDIPDIAGVIEAFRIDRFGRLLRFIEITEHYVFATNEDLVLCADLHLDPFERPSDRTDPIIVGTVRADDAGFGHSVSLQDRNAGSPKRVRELF